MSDDKLEKFDTEIQGWLCSPPKTLSRLRRFYDSIVSIHLGGEGLQAKIQWAKTVREAELIYKNYKINYPS